MIKASQMGMFGSGDLMSLPLLPSKTNPRVRRHQNPNKDAEEAQQKAKAKPQSDIFGGTSKPAQKKPDEVKNQKARELQWLMEKIKSGKLPKGAAKLVNPKNTSPKKQAANTEKWEAGLFSEGKKQGGLFEQPDQKKTAKKLSVKVGDRIINIPTKGKGTVLTVKNTGSIVVRMDIDGRTGVLRSGEFYAINEGKKNGEMFEQPSKIKSDKPAQKDELPKFKNDTELNNWYMKLSDADQKKYADHYQKEYERLVGDTDPMKLMEVVEKENEDYIRSLGYSDDQMKRMNPEAKQKIVDDHLKADQVSILKDGSLKVIEKERINIDFDKVERGKDQLTFVPSPKKDILTKKENKVDVKPLNIFDHVLVDEKIKGKIVGLKRHWNDETNRNELLSADIETDQGTLKDVDGARLGVDTDYQKEIDKKYEGERKKHSEAKQKYEEAAVKYAETATPKMILDDLKAVESGRNVKNLGADRHLRKVGLIKIKDGWFDITDFGKETIKHIEKSGTLLDKKLKEEPGEKKWSERLKDLPDPGFDAYKKTMKRVDELRTMNIMKLRALAKRLTASSPSMKLGKDEIIKIILKTEKELDEYKYPYDPEVIAQQQGKNK